MQNNDWREFALLLADENKLEPILETIPPRVAEILRLRLGTQDGYRWHLRQIGERLGVTGARIRQLEQKGFRYLRHHNRRHLLGLND